MTEKLMCITCGVNYSKMNQLVDLRYLSGTLELILASGHADETKKSCVAFDWVHSFRVTDEGDLLRMQDDLNGQMVIGIYTVEGSRYLTWFNEQSVSAHDGDNITHYLIVTDNDVIDVLSSVSPIISFC
ncbi:exonuclease SbcCD subunit D C-terminal domain-containing protein [Cedecea sp. NFIX57]|uniref:exonuclease SbcCD subunit D C-terminal domain-containing protein n=1 Tax=Cedecea sp. NFIX57 TaxID=1566286 RepID=UPI000A1C8B04|nr:exonuclease SbcCD subunit D C-terminal domain-containing protein [Cedecea sp. NFIX57]